MIKWLDAGIIYPISDSSWVSPVQCIPKKCGITIFQNERNELIPMRTTKGWRICIDYKKLNKTTRKDHFQLFFMDQMLDRLACNEFYCFQMDIRDTIKQLQPQKTNIKLLLLARTIHFLLNTYLLAYVIHLPHFSDV